MNILDREGLVYFVKKMKTYLRKYVRLSDTGKISYQNLPFSVRGAKRNVGKGG